MFEGIFKFLVGTKGDTVSNLAGILTIWTILFVGIASFFQIKSYLEIKRNSKIVARRVAQEISEKQTAKSVRNLEKSLITRLTVVTDLSAEFSEQRGNAWIKLAEALFCIIDDPSLNLNDETKNKLRDNFRRKKQEVFNISYELSYLLQLFDKEGVRRESARAYVRDNKITRGIRLLQLQLDSGDFENFSPEERDDIIRTIKEIEKKDKRKNPS